MNPLNGKEIPLQKFLHSSPSSFYHHALKRAEEELEYQQHLEDFRTGKLPWRVRVANTNRVNSILKIDGLTWERNHIAIDGVSVDTDEPIMTKALRDNRQYDWSTRSYRTVKEEVYYVHGMTSAGQFFRTRQDAFKLVLDDGTDVTKSVPRNADFVVMLGSDEPTNLYAPDAGLAKITFTDRFDQVIKTKDMVVFMSNETLKIGNIVRFYPRGGMLIRTIEGNEHKVMNPHVSTVLKIDSKLPDRVMLAKLSSSK